MNTDKPFIVPVRPRGYGPRIPTPQRTRSVRARFENALTTPDNHRHWQLADGLSIDAAANPAIRYLLRNRARQEYHNNSYLSGIAETIGNYVIGTGPSLQMTTLNKQFNKAVEKLFTSWAVEAALAVALKTSRVARLISGEGFNVMGTDPEMDHPVKMSLADIECERVTAPMLGMLPGQYSVEFLDGIELSPYGRPTFYNVLRNHPGGSANYLALGYESDRWPASYVLHDFRKIRPEQRRGVSEVAPALNVFADIRRYSTSVMTTADNAANAGQTIETEASAGAFQQDEGNPDIPEAFERVPLHHGDGIALPAGWTLKQTKPEQPTTTYDMFIGAKLQEATRCTNLPLMFVTMNPAGANMSASYVVTAPLAKSIDVDRKLICEPLLNKLLREFIREASLVPRLLPNDRPPDFSHVWRWPQVREHADPKKVADGQVTKLKGGLASVPAMLAAEGQDWEEVLESQAKYLGMSVPDLQALLRQSLYATAGNPAPASLTPEPNPVPLDDPDPEQTSIIDDEE